MKVSFPHMGNLDLVLSSLLEGLRLDVVPPPPISKRTYELGSKYSPEFACLPLKINIGNYIEAIENGADTILMAGGWGPCRFGYYAQVERDILNDLGYKFDMVILEAPDNKFSDLFKQLKSLGENVSLKEAFQAVKFAWVKLNALEDMEHCLEYYLPRVINKDQLESVYEQTLKEIAQAGSKKEMKSLLEFSFRKMNQMNRSEEDVIKIGLLGEIYTLLEPAINCDVSRCLGRLGVEVKRAIYLSEWVDEHLLGGLAGKSKHRQTIKSASPYINYWVGGHGRETIASAVEFARHNYDGLIQIGPLTCMPEIVAQTILPRVSENEKIPAMTLWFDEHSGTAGVQTRLEAFVDMISRKKSDVAL